MRTAQLSDVTRAVSALDAALPERDAEPESGHQPLPEAWFDYDQAFSRNIGWLTEWEQQQLREKRVAIAGMGGVGGVHMLTFARLGVGGFNVADFDRFGVENMNRQAGATARTMGKPKAASVVAMARDINPELDVNIFDRGVNEDNLDAFLDGVDVYIDGLDFFVLDIRRKLFAKARERGIPAITAGPLGMGTGYIVFTPDGLSFEDYFRFEGKSPNQQYINFLMGLTPPMLHRRYLADGSRVDMLDKRGPSTSIACQLCSGVAAVEAVKLMLKRGPVKAAPYYHHFDPYLGRFTVKKLRWGNAGPVQRLKTALVGRIVGHLSRGARPREAEPALDTPILTRILDVARWAPSPDNSQPWRFEQTSPTSLRVHLDLERGNPYAYRASEPIWLSAGMLMQALRLAASSHGWAMRWQLAGDAAAPVIEVDFDARAGVQRDPLAGYVKVRSVDRNAYRVKALTDDDRRALEKALGPGLHVTWLTGTRQRLKLSLVNAAATAIRLRSKACHGVHQQVIDWNNRFSRTGMPAGALGLDPLAQRIMRFVLGDWRRMKVASRWLGATLYAGLEMDILPGLRSGGFAAIHQSLASADRLRPEDKIVLGERIMRFWLEATRRGLAMQPALAALFCDAQADKPGLEPDLVRKAGQVADAYVDVTGLDPASVVFQCRLGYGRGRADAPRSIRRPLADTETVRI